MSAWPRSMSSTKRAMEHPRCYSLLPMAAAAAVMAAAAVVMVVVAVVTAGDVPRMSAAEAAATDADATAVTAAIMAAAAAVAPASFLAAVAVAEAAAEDTGAGLTACGPGALITGDISSALVALAESIAKCAVAEDLRASFSQKQQRGRNHETGNHIRRYHNHKCR